MLRWRLIAGSGAQSNGPLGPPVCPPVCIEASFQITSHSPQDVHVGRDGWLFLVGGQNRPLEFYRRSLAARWRRERLVRGWERILHTREARARALGCGFLHVPVPEKLSIYPEMADYDIDPALGPARGLAARIGDRDLCVDLSPALIAAKSDGQVYLRTDTHWTSVGCRIAHDAICAAAGAATRWTLGDRPLHAFESQGDLGVTFVPPRHEIQHRVEVSRDAVRAFTNPLLTRYEEAGRGGELHRGAHVIYRNQAPVADQRRVVVFGDSCSHFVDYMLTGMLAESFGEVHFVWSAGVDWHYVEQVRPDLLVTEIAERFMARLPRDDFDLESFASAKLAAFVD